MKWLSTVIVVVLASAGAVALMMTDGREGIAELNEPQSRRLLASSQFPVDEVSSITLERANHPPLTFEREGPQWSQTQPFAFPMDPFSIRQFAVIARELTALDQLSPADLGAGVTPETLQLSPPAARVTYEWSGGELALELGRRSVAGRAYLRVVGDSAIYIVPHTLHERALDMNPMEWRDRTIFQNVGVESERIEWSQAAGTSMTLIRDRKTWKMTEPVQTRLDPTARDAYLQALGAARVSGFLRDQPTQQELARFGLATPVATLTVNSGSAGGAQRLFIGGRVSANSQDHFGLIEGRPVVVRVPAAVLTSLFRPAANLVAPTGSGAQPADVKIIVIRTDDQELRLERDLERWRTMGETRRNVNPAHVQELLDQLTRLRAPDVRLGEYPREQEVATITLHGYDTKALDTVRIARDQDTDRWIFENGDSVLRYFPAGLKIRLTSADFDL